MKFSPLLIAAVAGLMISGCANDSTIDLTGGMPQGDITYTAHVRPIVTSNCVRCHGDVQLNGAPMALTSYAAVKEAIQNRGLLDRISRHTGEEGLMPNGGPRMPQVNIDIITKWQSDGFLEN